MSTVIRKVQPDASSCTRYSNFSKEFNCFRPVLTSSGESSVGTGGIVRAILHHGGGISMAEVMCRGDGRSNTDRWKKNIEQRRNVCGGCRESFEGKRAYISSRPLALISGVAGRRLFVIFIFYCYALSNCKEPGKRDPFCTWTDQPCRWIPQREG